ncbi:predicted protein [Nematostella vectensis]|uniref:Uncharacterized protein n=1 Tax=Nematostella vectensis TaxID=45351 RepID=A7RYC8_NEMVE|nr:predicted protein [Nematostella vectensis]|eukprot:XP_001635503.1 predicted protein [Nematostella vectensis]
MNASVSFTLISLVFLTMLLAQTRSHVIQETTFSSKRKAWKSFGLKYQDEKLRINGSHITILVGLRSWTLKAKNRHTFVSQKEAFPRGLLEILLSRRKSGTAVNTYSDYVTDDDILNDEVLASSSATQRGVSIFNEDLQEFKEAETKMMVRSDTGSRTLLDDKRAIGVHEIGKRLNGVDLPDMYCAPYPKVVPVPQRHFSQYVFPMNVQLHRCAGTPQCSIGGSHICTLKRRETILLKVTEANTGSFNYVTMHNHTACHCACTKQPSDCNQFQRFDEIACACVCKRKWKCSAGKTWNPKLCYCECETPCLKDQSRDPVTCACIRSW